MSLENISLDIDFVRSQFPAFTDQLSKKWSFFENAGGSYVPQTVIDNLIKFMISTKVQPYAEYDMSKIAGNQMDQAIKLFAKMINVKSSEILIGGSTTLNIYVLSNALKKFLKYMPHVMRNIFKSNFPKPLKKNCCRPQAEGQPRPETEQSPVEILLCIQP